MTGGPVTGGPRSRGTAVDAHVVEELAHAFGAFGVPRMAGRILGCLLVSTEPYETLDSLASELGASKASMSTMARMLAGAGLIERVAVPGGRRDHYRLRPDAWPELNRDRVVAFSRLGEVAEGAAAAAGRDAGGGRALADLARFCGVVARDLQGLPDRCRGEAGSASPS